MSHPDDAVDEMYALYEIRPNGEKKCVFRDPSLPYVRLKMRVLCDEHVYNRFVVPTYLIEAE